MAVIVALALNVLFDVASHLGYRATKNNGDSSEDIPLMVFVNHKKALGADHNAIETGECVRCMSEQSMSIVGLVVNVSELLSLILFWFMNSCKDD